VNAAVGRADDRQVRNLVLIGYRGCGKSCVGRQVAARLGWSSIDTDEQVEALAGRPIAAIFEQDGEAAFRSLEEATIARVTRGDRQVISVGGGAVLSEANRHALRAAGLCVWLAAPPEELHRRIQADPRTAAVRPRLTDRGGLDEIRHLLRQRQPLYAALADHVVQTAGQSIEQVVEAVLSAMSTGRACSGTL
jgi:shikimate kinase